MLRAFYKFSIVFLGLSLFACTGADLSQLRSNESGSSIDKTVPPSMIAGINLLECQVFHNPDPSKPSQMACRVKDDQGNIIKNGVEVNGIRIRTDKNNAGTETVVSGFFPSRDPDWNIIFEGSRDEISNIEEVSATILVNGETIVEKTETILESGLLAFLNFDSDLGQSGSTPLNNDVQLYSEFTSLDAVLCRGAQTGSGCDSSGARPKLVDSWFSSGECVDANGEKQVIPSNLAFPSGSFPGNALLSDACTLDSDSYISFDSSSRCRVSVDVSGKKLGASKHSLCVKYDNGPNHIVISSGVNFNVYLGPSRVIGQDDLASNAMNRGGFFTPAANSLLGPQSVAVRGNKMYIADTQNHRVLVYDRSATSNSSASVVLGQADFVSNVAGSTVTLDELNRPGHVTSTESALIVSDSDSNRVIFRSSTDYTPIKAVNTPPGVDKTSAGVFGGNFFMTSTTGEIFMWDSLPTSWSGATPAGYKLDSVYQGGNLINEIGSISHALATNTSAGTRFIVTEQLGNRVLIWNSFPGENVAGFSTQGPAIVLGQQDFTGTDAGMGLSELSSPSSAATDGKRLFVADQGNNRILVWKNLPSESGQVADMEITLNGLAGITPLAGPSGVFVDTTNHELYVADTNNNRVLVIPLPNSDENW